MAKSQYNGDSPFPSLFSEHPGMSGSPEIIPVKTATLTAMPASEAYSGPASYSLSGGAVMYTGESVDCERRLRDHATSEATPHPDRVYPPTTSTID